MEILTGSGQSPVAVLFQGGNESSGSKIGGAFQDSRATISFSKSTLFHRVTSPNILVLGERNITKAAIYYLKNARTKLYSY
jgi:hypothetical protein